MKNARIAAPFQLNLNLKASKYVEFDQGFDGTDPGCLGASWGRLGASWGVLGSSWEVLGASWERLGSSWVRLGAVLERLGPIFGAGGSAESGALGSIKIFFCAITDRIFVALRRSALSCHVVEMSWRDLSRNYYGSGKFAPTINAIPCCSRTTVGSLPTTSAGRNQPGV